MGTSDESTNKTM